MTISEQKIEQYREGFLEFHEIEPFLSEIEKKALLDEIPNRIGEIQNNIQNKKTFIADELAHIQKLERFIQESKKLIAKTERRQENLEGQMKELSRIHSKYS